MRLYFSELAKELQLPGVSYPPAGDVPPEPPKPQGGSHTHPNVWGKAGGEKALAYLKEHYPPGSTFEYDGHGDCWMMLAIMDQLRDRKLCTYLGGPFDKVLDIDPYRTGPEAAPGQPCTFSLVEQGDDVCLTVHLAPDGSPFDMPFSEIIAPQIPAGKNIYVRLDGRHLLFAFPISLTYGATCRSLIMDYAGECVCSVSNRDDLEVGDSVQSPFN